MLYYSFRAWTQKRIDESAQFEAPFRVGNHDPTSMVALAFDLFKSPNLQVSPSQPLPIGIENDG